MDYLIEEYPNYKYLQGLVNEELLEVMMNMYKNGYEHGNNMIIEQDLKEIKELLVKIEGYLKPRCISCEDTSMGKCPRHSLMGMLGIRSLHMIYALMIIIGFVLGRVAMHLIM